MIDIVSEEDLDIKRDQNNENVIETEIILNFKEPIEVKSFNKSDRLSVQTLTGISVDDTNIEHLHEENQLKDSVLSSSRRSISTEDFNFDDRIKTIKLQQKQYTSFMNNNKHVVEQLTQTIKSHRHSSTMFAELAKADKPLSEIFISLSLSEIMVANQVQELIDKLVISTTTLDTLVKKTFKDTLLGVQACETARIEYNSLKTDTDKLMAQIERKSSSNLMNLIKLQGMQEELKTKSEKYESAMASVRVKMDLLEDNRIRVIEREILNLRHAWFSLHANCLDLYAGNRSVSVTISSEEIKTEIEASVQYH